MYYLGAALLLALEVFFLIHAYRRGRMFWFYIMLFVPVAGILAYVVAEMLPDLRTGREANSLRGIQTEIVRLADPSREYQRLKDQLAFSDTFSNRQALADECLRCGLYDEAIQHYTNNLQGVFATDESAMFGLAYAYLLSEQYDEAEDALRSLRDTNPKYNPSNVALMFAQVLGGLGDEEGAIAEFEAAVESAWGWEARVKLGEYLKETGRRDRATDVFEDILRRSERATRAYRKSQRQWLNVARRNLEEFKAE